MYVKITDVTAYVFELFFSAWPKKIFLDRLYHSYSRNPDIVDISPTPLLITVFITKKLKNLVDSVRYVYSKTNQTITNEIKTR